MENNDDSNTVKTAGGRELTLRFDSALCIHSRFCVLQAPTVFKANTPGEWIFPDNLDAPALAAVARNCPSGAITYEAKDAVLNEVDPPVNTVRTRQDGPYAISAAIQLAGHESDRLIRRRTLCRCGASKNKPFCDGSHVEAKFEATGEPATEPYKPLGPRDGPLEIIPLKDGPLEVRGSVEFVSGTGRTFAKTSHTLLCRCGGSSSKPFCDGTHSLNGFCDKSGFEWNAKARTTPSPISVAEFAGGRDKLKELTTTFYIKVPTDPILAPVFARMDQRHAEHVADFLAEVFGGPPIYSTTGGSHIGMIAKHLGRHITEQQRERWVAMMIETADDVGMPVDPAFRDTFVSYLEWGSKLAVINSAPGVDEPEGDWPMPQWGWGPSRGPSSMKS